MFEEASFGVPMVYFHDYPDVTIHTNKDQPENLDATKLGRVAYMGAGIAWTLAALPDAEAARLLRYARAQGEAAIALSRQGEDRDSLLASYAAITTAQETLRSVAALWPSTAAAVGKEDERLREMASLVKPPAAPGGDARVPVRNPEVRGPLDVYYYNELTAKGVRTEPALLQTHAGRSADVRDAQPRRRKAERVRDPGHPHRALRSRSALRNRGVFEPARDRPGHHLEVTAPFDFSATNLDREFPVRKSLVYFNHAAVAPLPRRVSDAIVAHVENIRDRGAADWRKWYGGIDRARRTAAGFLGADRSQVAFLPSTSWALNLVARSFAWKAGDNVVGDDMEFPSNALPWKSLEREGVEYRVAHNRSGRVTFDDIAAKVDGRTRVIAVSWVAFHNGFVFPIETIGEFCRSKGILFVVDGIQGLGALPLDVSKTKIDVLAADAHKWLLAQECCTVFYVSDAAREKLRRRFSAGGTSRRRRNRPSSRRGGRYSPADGATSRVLCRRPRSSASKPRSVCFKKSACRWCGTGSSHSSERFARGSRRAAGASRHRSRWDRESSRPSPSRNERAVAKELERRGIIVAPREGAVRFSPHVGNDADEITRALSAIDEIA